MTLCEHCGKLGGAQNVCLTLSSQVIVTHGSSRDVIYMAQPCPSAGVIDSGGSACPIALAVNKRHPAMMPRRQWASYEVKLHQEKLVAEHQGRVFGPTIKTIRYNR